MNNAEFSYDANSDEVTEVLTHILEFEANDFWDMVWNNDPEYDLKGHVYYKARKLRDGIKAADEELAELIKGRDE